MAYVRKEEAEKLANEFNSLHPVQQQIFIQYLKDEGWFGSEIETLENLVKINSGFSSAL